MQLSTNQKLDTIAVQKIRTLVQNGVVPVLKTTRSPPDVEEIYLNEFGSLGTVLYELVQKERQKAAAAAATAAAAAAASNPAGSSQNPSVSMVRPAQPVQNSNPQLINAGVISSGGQRFLIANNAQQPTMQPNMISPNQGNNQQRVILAPAQQQQRYFYPPSQP